MGQEFVVINSEKTVRALLDQRSAVYSDRPILPARKFYGIEWITTLMRYGAELRSHRKVVPSCINIAVFKIIDCEPTAGPDVHCPCLSMSLYCQHVKRLESKDVITAVQSFPCQSSIVGPEEQDKDSMYFNLHCCSCPASSHSLCKLDTHSRTGSGFTFRSRVRGPR
ncbi:hypothetical protein EDB19DRAFT_907368 [Suillus lakei]|nr:hypothetical protein EDB19DRAFT_120467 [Suillus lakei]KAG1738241.1 hypothetical protein EDB19DRAFT_907368 [Suillus lakei]